MATLFDPLSTLITWSPPVQSVIFTQVFTGVFVKVQRDEDNYKKKTGANGDVAMAKVRNKGGSIEVTLLMTSPTNAILSAIHLVGESVPPTGDDIGPIQVKDLLGGTIAHAKSAWIKKVANVEFGDEIQGRTWTFDCESLDIVLGGGGIAS